MAAAPAPVPESSEPIGASTTGEKPQIEVLDEMPALEEQPVSAIGERGGYRELASIAATETPSLTHMALEELAAEEAEPLDEAVSDLLHHLDETLDLIRSMKSAPH